MRELIAQPTTGRECKSTITNCMKLALILHCPAPPRDVGHSYTLFIDMAGFSAFVRHFLVSRSLVHTESIELWIKPSGDGAPIHLSDGTINVRARTMRLILAHFH